MNVGVGRIYGRAGYSLEDSASWVKNQQVASIGKEAEVRTGDALNALTVLGPTVLHDLRIPIPGFTANIDHVIVSGRNILLLDSKKWAGGVYWTLAGHTRRGLAPFPAADKQTLPLAQKHLERHLAKQGATAPNFLRPALVVWSNGNANLTLFRGAGKARAVHGPSLRRFLSLNLRPRTADPSIVRALLPLVNGY